MSSEVFSNARIMHPGEGFSAGFGFRCRVQGVEIMVHGVSSRMYVLGCAFRFVQQGLQDLGAKLFSETRMIEEASWWEGSEVGFRL